MAKKAAIFWRMVGSQRCFFVLSMATETVRLRFLLIVNGIKTIVNFIVRQVRCGFLRCPQEKNENAGADDDERGVDGQLFSGAQSFHTIYFPVRPWVIESASHFDRTEVEQFFSETKNDAFGKKGRQQTISSG